MVGPAGSSDSDPLSRASQRAQDATLRRRSAPATRPPATSEASREAFPGPPRASRRSVFEVFATALAELDRFQNGVPYDQLNAFTQGWLKGRVTDHGNALRLLRFWGLVAPSGVLDREFVAKGDDALRTSDFDEFRRFLRARFVRAYETMAGRRKQPLSVNVLEQFGRDDWDPRMLDSLPGIVDEPDPQTKDKRRQCVAAVGDVIRFCDDRSYLAAESAPKGVSAAESPAVLAPEDLLAAMIKSRAEVVTRRFNFRDENHNHVEGQVSFDVPKTSFWIEQLALKLLDWADDLREQERSRST